MLDAASLGAPASDIVCEALDGLTACPKTLPPKFFYDAEGSRLFQQITELPEYYPTRTELALLRTHAGDIAAALPRGPAALIEYGAAQEDKAALLFQPCEIRQYLPIDVAGPALDALLPRMRHTHPAIEVRPIEADFLSPLTLPASIFGLGRLGFFAGSTIGNLEPQSAMEFLRGVRRTLGPGAALLVGVDLPKDPSILVPAYNDRAGVTAAFNLNILARLNRDAGADFCTDDFIHRAIWNSDKSRIEMHLVSRRRQRVRLGGQTIGFERDETIHTENSYKHAVPRFQDMARQSGWQPASVWTDKAQWFSLHLLVDGQAA